MVKIQSVNTKSSARINFKIGDLNGKSVLMESNSTVPGSTYSDYTATQSQSLATCPVLISAHSFIAEDIYNTYNSC